jgi:hypothetical protein
MNCQSSAINDLASRGSKIEDRSNATLDPQSSILDEITLCDS